MHSWMRTYYVRIQHSYIPWNQMASRHVLHHERSCDGRLE